MGHEATHCTLLPGGQYHEQPGTPTKEVCQDRTTLDIAAWRAVRQRTGISPGEGYRCGSRGAYFVLPTAAILFSGGLEGPAWQDWELRHWAAAKTRLEQRPMTEGPRRNAS